MRTTIWALVTMAGTAACSTSSMSSELEIVANKTESLTAVAGDALQLSVVEILPDGSQRPLASSDMVAWGVPATVDALDSGSTSGTMPTFSAAPTAIFVDNALRPERSSDLSGVLFVADPGASGGTTTVTARVTGSITATVTATVAVSTTPAGNPAHGATLYAAACAGCHGKTGSGTAANADGTFTMGGKPYDYPAPGINGADGNLAADPNWSPALLALAARADIDNAGVVLRLPMPDWLGIEIGGAPLTTQDFADIYTYLKTQQQ